MRLWQQRYPYYQTTVPEAYHAFLGVWKILRHLEAALAAALAPNAEKEK